MKESYTAAEMVAAIVQKHPPLTELFPIPEVFEPLRVSSPLLSVQYEKRASDTLLEQILYLFEINETQVELAYIPGKGWGAGCTLSTTLQGVTWEGKATDPPFNRCPGHVLLAMLFTLIVDLNYRPIAIKPNAWMKRKVNCESMSTK